jgi:hypothetical protein
MFIYDSQLLPFHLHYKTRFIITLCYLMIYISWGFAVWQMGWEMVPWKQVLSSGSSIWSHRLPQWVKNRLPIIGVIAFHVAHGVVLSIAVVPVEKSSVAVRTGSLLIWWKSASQLLRRFLFKMQAWAVLNFLVINLKLGHRQWLLFNQHEAFWICKCCPWALFLVLLHGNWFFARARKKGRWWGNGKENL